MARHSKIVDIVREVRRFDRRALIGEFARLAASLDTEPSRARIISWPRGDVAGFRLTPLQIVVSTHELAAFARVVLAHGEGEGRTSPSEKDFVRLANQVGNLPSRLTTEQPGSVGLDEFLFEVANQQFSIQHNDEHQALGRALVLFEQVPKLLEKEGLSIPFSLDEEFICIAGMPMRQFVWCGMWICGKAIEGERFRLGRIEEKITKLGTRWVGPERDMPSAEAMSHTLSQVSLEFDGFKDRIGDLRKQDERSIAKDYHPLLEYPLVKLDSEWYSCPIPKFLIDRFTDGLFHDLANGIKSKGGGNRFRTYFGTLFERYVGRQLELVFPHDRLEPEQAYGSSGARKTTPDWFINAESPRGVGWQ